MVKLSEKRVVIVEIKGHEDLDVAPKMQRLREWCLDINRVQTAVKCDLIYVERFKPKSFRDLVRG